MSYMTSYEAYVRALYLLTRMNYHSASSDWLISLTTSVESEDGHFLLSNVYLVND
jgi:hypothetical protein